MLDRERGEIRVRVIRLPPVAAAVNKPQGQTPVEVRESRARLLDGALPLYIQKPCSFVFTTLACTQSREQRRNHGGRVSGRFR